MAMLVDEKEMATTLQLAARRPIEGFDPGFVERFKSDFTAMYDGKNANVREKTRSDLQDEYIRDFYQASGQRLRRWLGGPGVNTAADLEQSARTQVDQWRKENPGTEFRDFPTEDFLQAETIRRAGGAIDKSDALGRQSAGWGSAIGGFAGTAAGAMLDPINAMSLALGAGAGGVVKTALTEGVIGMASETAIQGINYDFRKQVDPNYSSSDAMYEIAAAGAGGAVLGGGIKGIAKAWHRAKTGEWPRHIKDAGNVMQREAAVPESRFEKSMGGDNAHRAALEKSVDDIIRGRPVELPPEAFMQANARPGRVYDADGNSIGVRYEVVDAESLITSNRDDLSINPDFPQELQPRDRSRAMSQDQISGIAANLQPERLGFSTDAGTGAPVVGLDGLVESGNGRVMALRRAYQAGGVPAENYRNFLRSQNFDVEGITNPVLVARRITELEDRVGFVTAANRSTTMRLGAAEQALADARLIDTALLDSLGDADIGTAGNAAFTRGFMSRLPRAEQGALIDKNGVLSQDGGRRIVAALMGRAYGEPSLLGRALEDTDNNIKAIGGALSDSAGQWSRMRDAVSRGEIPAGMDLTDDLLKAVQLVIRARDEGRTVSDLVNQAEMFGGPGEMAKIMARAMFSDVELKRPVGRARLAAFLRDYADEAMKNDAGPRLIGNPLDAPDILKGSLERVGRNDLMRVAEERLTPEKIDEMAAAPETAEATLMEAQRLRAFGYVPAAEKPLTIHAPSDFPVADAGTTKRQLLNNVRAWAMERFGDKTVTNASDGSSIIIARSGIKHSTARDSQSRRAIAAMANLDELIQNARFVSTEPDKLGRRNILGVHLYEAPVRIDGEDAKMRIVVREDNTGRRFYDHSEMKGLADDPATGKPLDQGGLHPTVQGSSTGGNIPRVGADRQPIMVDLGDGLGERSLGDILDEADAEIAAARDIEACALGRETDT